MNIMYYILVVYLIGAWISFNIAYYNTDEGLKMADVAIFGAIWPIIIISPVFKVVKRIGLFILFLPGLIGNLCVYLREKRNRKSLRFKGPKGFKILDK